MTPTVFLTALLAAPAAPVLPDDKPAVAAGHPLRQVVASVGKDGKFQVKETQIAYVPETRTELVVVDGKQVARTVTVVVPVSKTVLRPLDDKQVKVFGTDGKQVDAKKLPELLRKDTVVLLAEGVEKPDAAWLQVLKEGTLILAVPITQGSRQTTPLPPERFPEPPVGKKPADR